MTSLDCHACVRMERGGYKPPSNDLPYFWKAYAQDPRTTGVHEGVPGISSNYRCLGEIPIPSGVSTTIRARTKASASTPKR